MEAIFRGYDKLPEELKAELPLKRTWALVLEEDDQEAMAAHVAHPQRASNRNSVDRHCGWEEEVVQRVWSY